MELIILFLPGRGVLTALIKNKKKSTKC